MRLPQVKPEHAPYRLANGSIRIGGVVHGIAAEIPNAEEAVWTLLTTMDGTSTQTEVVQRVAEHHPELAVDDIRVWLGQLMRSGHVFDAAETPPAALSRPEQERYNRSIGYFRWVNTHDQPTWAPQSKLRQAHVTVIGIGGTGGSAALALAASGVGDLHLVDNDTVELSNLNRQLAFRESDIGEAKSTAAARQLQALNSDITITSEYASISSADDVARLAHGRDLILLCADSPRETRVWTNRGCLRTRTAWVDAGYHGPLTQVALYEPGGPCWECLREVHRELHRAQGANPTDGIERHDATPNAVNAITAGISGNLAAHAAISRLTGAPPFQSGKIHSVNLANLTATPVTQSGPRRNDCPGCGEIKPL